MDIARAGSAFLKSFLAAKQQREQTDQDKRERDARLKLFEIQLEREKQQNQLLGQQTEARTQLMDRLQGAERLPGTGVKLLDPTAKTPSLTELLADPDSAMQLLQSGFIKSDDIIKQQASVANREMLANLIGGGGSARGMELQGLKVGPSGELMPDFGLPQVTAPQTINTPEGPRLKTFNPRTGREVADLGAPKPDTVAPETAGRIAGLEQAKQIAKSIESQFVRPDGSIDQGLVLSSFSNMPGSKGREIKNDILIAVDAVLRARTGAGVNVKEQDDVVSQFMPSPLDSNEGKIKKIKRLQQFVDGTLDIATLPPDMRKRLEKSGGSGKEIDFSELPD